MKLMKISTSRRPRFTHDDIINGGLLKPESEYLPNKPRKDRYALIVSSERITDCKMKSKVAAEIGLEDGPSFSFG